MIATFVMSGAAHGGAILFVDDDAPPSGNGSSWDTAYRFLQDALTEAGGGGIAEIHLGQGMYYPDRDEANPKGTCDPGPCDREATFQLINGVALMGGYAGIGAKDPDARDIELYETILSGDLLGNDGPDFQDNDENSYHVLAAVSLSQSTALDGLTVRAGNASGEKLEFRRGGALRAVVSDLIIAQCKFEFNTAELQGGAIYLLACTTEITDCTFFDNLASDSDSDGGAVCSNSLANVDSQWLRLRSSLFQDNAAADLGGAVCIEGPHEGPVADDFEITDCTFVANAALGGGAAYLSGIGDHNTTTLIGFPIRRCDFFYNSVQGFGGAIYAGNVQMNLLECRFFGNSGHLGGSVYFAPHLLTPTNIVACVFFGNSATGANGGGLYLERSGNTVVNCLFAWNSAANRGGGAYFANNPGSNELTLSGCTFTSNSAGDTGGGSFVSSNGAEFSNSVFWENSDSSGTGELAQIYTFGTVEVDYCCIDGWTGSSKQLSGVGNIDADPLFVFPGNGDFRLSPGSPCIDAGNNWGVPIDDFDYDEDGVLCELFPVDLDGHPRFNADEADFDPGCGVPIVVDMGAYEYQFDPVENVVFADLNADGAVGVKDLLGLLGSWGLCGKGCCLADLDIDGNVGVSDLLTLLGNWGPCP